MNTIVKKTLIAAMALATAGAALTATPAAAWEHRYHGGYYRGGRGAALIGGLAAGALLGGVLSGGFGPRYSYGYGYAPAYSGDYYGGQECWIERRPVHDYWGDVVGYRRVRTCN